MNFNYALNSIGQIFFLKKKKRRTRNHELDSRGTSDVGADRSPATVNPSVASPSISSEDTMGSGVCIYYKCQGGVYCVVVNEEITLEKLEGRLYKKHALDESKVKVEMSYIPMMIGCEDQMSISSDEDLVGYVMTVDKENRRPVLNVEVVTRSELPSQQSRAGKSSYGMNYDNRNDEQIGPNALTLYVENGEANQEEEVREDDDDDVIEDNGMDTSGMRDEYFEEPPVVQGSQFVAPWEDGFGVAVGNEFQDKKAVIEYVRKMAFRNSFDFVIPHSDKTRWIVQCSIPRCSWGLRAARIDNTDMFSIRRYTKMHTCNRSDQSGSVDKRMRGSAQLVASFLSEKYPGELETPRPNDIMGLIQREYGVDISYSTALRGRNQAVTDLRGSPEDGYKMLYRYLYMLEEVNPGTISSVEVDKAGKFKYLFIALGATLEGFEHMRKVIVVDATWLKNGYGGVLVFAVAQDPNRHTYPIAFGVLDGENNASWTWFFEMLKSVLGDRGDSSELVFVSDRNQSLINAIGNVFPRARHGYCLWHLAQNVKGHASNANNKSVVAFRFQECGWAHTEAEFYSRYQMFERRFPAAHKYAEEKTVKEKWARCFFPGDRYNIDTSNSAESLNNTFNKARKYSLLPMLDTIMRKFSDWFNEHRKEAVSGHDDNKLVPFVENFFHDNWPTAKKLSVREVNSYDLEYEVVDIDGKVYLVNLDKKSCSCRFFDIQKYACLHAMAAFISFKKNGGGVRGRDTQIELHELCSKYYWTDLWALAYHKSIYVVPDMSAWVVPEYIKEKQILPPDRKITKGRRRVTRFPSTGEGRRRRTPNKRRRRTRPIEWMLFGEDNI